MGSLAAHTQNQLDSAKLYIEKLELALNAEKLALQEYKAQHSGLVERVEKLESAIRTHRDQEGDDRCWLDDRALYHSITEPDGSQAVPDLALPPKCEFLESCSRYWERRQSPADKHFGFTALPGGMTIAELEAHVAELKLMATNFHEVNQDLHGRINQQWEALKRLSDYQHLYSHCTHGCEMPGNDLYSGILMSIVRDARAVLGPESERPLSGSDMELILSDGRRELDAKEKA